MKKTLLLSAAMLVSFGIMAQVSIKSSVLKADAKTTELKGIKKIEPRDVNKIYPVKKEGNYSPATPIKISGTKNPKASQYVQISSSANVFSVLLPEQNCLAANQDGNVISFAHRRSATLGSGDIQISFSTDGGETFDDQSLTIWDDATNGFPGRYPAGVIYNPNGLTDLASIYAVGAGPTLDPNIPPSGDWNGGFFASQTFTGENYNYSMSLSTDPGAENNFLPRYYMQVSGEKIFIYGNNTTIDTTLKAYTDVKTVINIGTWNASTNSFDWTLSEFSPVNDMFKKANGAIEVLGIYPAMAFDDDGLTGYLVYTGRDKTAADTLSYIPMIYKTTDGALTWTKIPFDWENASGSLVADMEEVSPVKRPLFGGIKDAVVDGLGQLHFAAFVEPAAKDHPDSLAYIMTYTYIKGFMYDTYLKNNDQDIVSFIIDFVRADDNEKKNTLIDPNTDDFVTWDERLQMGKSIDGMSIVFSWLDTDSSKVEPGEKKPINNQPNVHIKMLNVVEESIGPTINVTGEEENDFRDFCYWMYLSNDLIEKPGEVLFVPISISSLNTDSDGPVEHFFINNTYINKNTGEIISGINEENSIVSETTSIYPNPTSGNVNISFNDNAKGKYNINVFNAIGSLVYSESIDVNSSVIRTINLEEMPNGIYMVQISNDKSTNTQKIIKN